MLPFLRALLDRGIKVAWTWYFGGKKVSTFKTKPNGFKPTWIVIHHSFSSDTVTTRNWDSIRNYHMSYRHKGVSITKDQYDILKERNEFGLETPWSDVGYNFGIENVNGKLMILDGRMIGEVGAHAMGFNAKSIGICLVGNYDNDPPSEDRLEAMAHLCRDLQREFSIPRANVIGHRETFVLLGGPVLKSCPGEMFDMNEFRKRLIDV